MSVGNANLFNALTLVIMGMWGYKVTNSPTALIPVFVGALLLVMTNFIRVHHKIVSHIAVVLTLLILIAVGGRILPAAIKSGDNMKLIRAGAMTFTSALALIIFIKSFIDVRKSKVKGPS